MAYHNITDRTSGRNVATILQGIVNGNVVVSNSDRRPVVDALMQDLKEGGVTKDWSEEERALALQALKTLGRSTEGCESIFAEEGIRTLMYHSGLCKETEDSIDKATSKEALKCLANALLLKPTTQPIVERLGGYGECSTILKRSDLSNESQFLFCRVLFFVTVNAPSIVKSLMDDYDAVDNLEVVLKTQLARSPDGTMFTQSMVLSEALKYVFNLMMVDRNIERSEESNFTEQEKILASGRRFQSLLPTIVSILTTIPLPTPSSLKPPHSNAINALLNFPIPSSTHLITRPQQEALLDVLTTILDETLKNSLNTDEEATADRLGLDNVAELDEVIPPLVIVLTNIASAGGEGRAALKAKLLPDDIDRSEPLEKGDSCTSRLVRRVTSIRFLNIRETVSQLLFVLCNEDPGVFTRYIGYGNAAGFLLNRGLGVPSSVTGAQVEEIDDEDEAETPLSTLPTPAATSSTPSAPSPALDSSSGSSTAQEINPITGAYYQDASAFRAAMAAMSEEEKEEEAGRLLDMLDRMRRTGVMDVRNPALEAGLRQRERDQYYEEQERKEQEEEEELERIYGKV